MSGFDPALDPCGCRDEAEHEQGQALQRKLRDRYSIPKGECVGCILGDDGPSMHDFDYGCEYGKGAEV